MSYASSIEALCPVVEIERHKIVTDIGLIRIINLVEPFEQVFEFDTTKSHVTANITLMQGLISGLSLNKIVDSLIAIADSYNLVCIEEEPEDEELLDRIADYYDSQLELELRDHETYLDSMYDEMGHYLYKD